MKNSFIKILFVIFTAIGVLEFSGQAKAVDSLVVEFENTPLFSEANFLPGEGITRWVKVTNNSGQTQRIAAEAINKSDPNRLGDVLNLEIKEGGTRLYKDALSKFFTTGEVYLSDLANGNTAQYDFIVTFYSGTGDAFQGKTLSFDLLVGFQGEEGGLLPGAGGGGGGFLPPGLTIQNQAVVTTTDVSVTITWNTSYPATSQVIYALGSENHALDLTDAAGIPPKYGYAHTTPESNISPKVINHSVTIYGLNPATTYYYRTVSHGSLAISQEYSFTTLGEKVEEKRVEEEIPQGITKEEVPLASPLVETEKPSAPEKAAPPEEEIVIVPSEEKAAEEGQPSLFLASLEVIQQSAWMKFALILSLLGLTAIGIKEWKLAGKNKKIC